MMNQFKLLVGMSMIIICLCLNIKPVFAGLDNKFFDSFENGEWNGNWTETGDGGWVTESFKTAITEVGSNVAHGDGCGTGCNLTSIDINTSDSQDASLTFNWGITGLDAGEYLVLDIYNVTGTKWENVVWTATGGTNSSSHIINLTPYGFGTTLKLRFRTLMDKTNEYAEIDIVSVNRTTPNVPPEMNTSRITPTTAYANDTLIGWCNATDSDSSKLYYHYRWYLYNDLNTSGQTTDNYTQGVEINVANITSGNLAKGQNWTFGCLANDTQNLSLWVNSSVLTINNSKPVTTTPTLSPVTVYKNTSEVSCVNGTTTDVDGDLITFYYQWYVDGVESVTTKNITNSSFVKNNVLNCTIIANDGTDNSTPYNSNTLTVQNSPPITPTSLTSSPGTVYVGIELDMTASGSNDADPGDSITYEYEFYNINDSTTRQAYSTTNTYTIQVVDAHDTIRVRSRAYDGTAYSAGEKETNVSITNSDPVMNTPRISPAVAYDNDNLLGLCNATDADDDNVTYNYIWYLNNELNTSGTTTSNYSQSLEVNVDTITSNLLVKEQNWTFSCQANDTMGSTSNWLNSSTVNIKGYKSYVIKLYLSSKIKLFGTNRLKIIKE